MQQVQVPLLGVQIYYGFLFSLPFLSSTFVVLGLMEGVCLLPRTELEPDGKTRKLVVGQRLLRRREVSVLCLPVFGILLLFLILLLYTVSVTDHMTIHRPLGSIVAQAVPCQEPTIRQEWRDLSASERSSYVAAVQCLRERPSIVGLDQSLYDDFPWVHSRVGNSCMLVSSTQLIRLTQDLCLAHRTSGFLPWHRYFLHIYETLLRETCGYRGRLTYNTSIRSFGTEQV